MADLDAGACVTSPTFSCFGQVTGPQVMPLWPLVILHSLSSMSPGPSSLPRQCSFPSHGSGTPALASLPGHGDLSILAGQPHSSHRHRLSELCRPFPSWPLLCSASVESILRPTRLPSPSAMALTYWPSVLSHYLGLRQASNHTLPSSVSRYGPLDILTSYIFAVF